MTTVLAIETSCDETAVAAVSRNGENIQVLADEVASQADIHALTGGVVPEVAAREHVQVIGPLISKVMKDADLSDSDISAVAVTVGPGLMPALSVGVNAARTLAYGWDKPLVPVHHIEGHLYSALLADTGKLDDSDLPALALIVSGGHTLLIHMNAHLQYRILGTTRDDAVGEAFDKVARMLGLPYPGGPQIARLAKEGDPNAYSFTRPMMKSGDLDFSFSGLKTEVLYTVRDLSTAELATEQANLAASFQQAAVEALITKTVRAVEQHGPQTVVLAGGVAANASLRQQLAQQMNEHEAQLRVAPLELCGDNAVMIGQVGAVAFEAGRTVGWQEIDAHARMDITDFD